MLKFAIHSVVLAAAILIDVFILDFPYCTYLAFGILVYLELFKRGRDFGDHKKDLRIAGKLCAAITAGWFLSFASLIFIPTSSGNAAFGLGIFLYIAVAPILFMMGMYAMALSAATKRN